MAKTQPRVRREKKRKEGKRVCRFIALIGKRRIYGRNNVLIGYHIDYLMPNKAKSTLAMLDPRSNKTLPDSWRHREIGGRKTERFACGRGEKKKKKNF